MTAPTTAPRVLVLNGPNLGRLGSREPEVYGTATFDDLAAACREAAAELGLEVDVRQTDDESELVGWLHEAADSGAAVVLNPAAFTHYSYALRDACAARDRPARRGAPQQPRGPGGVPAHVGGRGSGDRVDHRLRCRLLPAGAARGRRPARDASACGRPSRPTTRPPSRSGPAADTARRGGAVAAGGARDLLRERFARDDVWVLVADDGGVVVGVAQGCTGPRGRRHRAGAARAVPPVDGLRLSPDRWGEGIGGRSWSTRAGSGGRPGLRHGAALHARGQRPGAAALRRQGLRA